MGQLHNGMATGYVVTHQDGLLCSEM